MNDAAISLANLLNVERNIGQLARREQFARREVTFNKGAFQQLATDQHDP